MFSLDHVKVRTHLTPGVLPIYGQSLYQFLAPESDGNRITELQTQRVVGVVRDLWSTSSPMLPVQTQPLTVGCPGLY